MKAERATFPAFGIDTVLPLSRQFCMDLVRQGYSFAVRYLGSLTPEEVARITGTGLALMPVTYASNWNNPDKALRQLEDLDIPRRVHVWNDLEGRKETVAEICDTLDHWAGEITGVNYQAGLYVGAGCGLTGQQLWKRPDYNQYWRGCSIVPVPDYRGFSMYQMFPPNVRVCGFTVDIDVICQDWKRDLPMWVVAD